MPKAVVCRELGPPEQLRLETFPSAPLAPGQVRVAIHAAGINFPDILMAAGEYQLKPPLPFTPGVEAAGDVVEVNGAAGVAIGDKVIVKMRHGAYSDEAVVTPSQLIPLPSTFDYAEGATFLAGHGTAHHALIDRGRLEPGEVLLVHGAGGGSGLTAIEVGKAMGAIVIASAGGADKLAAARQAGADRLIDYRKEDLRTRVLELTGGRGADVIYDPVGGSAFDASLRCVAPEGRLIPMGFASGTIPQIPANNMRVGLGFAYAVRARVLLAMRDYSNARNAADSSLAINSNIEDHRPLLSTGFSSGVVRAPMTPPDNLFYAAFGNGGPAIWSFSLEFPGNYFEGGTIIVGTTQSGKGVTLSVLAAIQPARGAELSQLPALRDAPDDRQLGRHRNADSQF